MLIPIFFIALIVFSAMTIIVLCFDGYMWSKFPNGSPYVAAELWGAALLTIIITGGIGVLT